MSDEKIRQMIREEVDRRLRAVMPDLFVETPEELSYERQEELRQMARKIMCG